MNRNWIKVFIAAFLNVAKAKSCDTINKCVKKSTPQETVILKKISLDPYKKGLSFSSKDN